MQEGYVCVVKRALGKKELKDTFVILDIASPSIEFVSHLRTGSDHIREKDGLWAALAWLQVNGNIKGR